MVDTQRVNAGMALLLRTWHVENHYHQLARLIATWRNDGRLGWRRGGGSRRSGNMPTIRSPPQRRRESRIRRVGCAASRLPLPCCAPKPGACAARAWRAHKLFGIATRRRGQTRRPRG